MGFSENLENNLKNLESREEKDPAQILREREREENDRKRRRAAAPYEEQLRTGSFTQELLGQATRIGFSKRTKVHIVWLDSMLRLDARNLRMELRPTPDGIVAHYFADGKETGTAPVDLGGDAGALAQDWLEKLV